MLKPRPRPKRCPLTTHVAFICGWVRCCFSYMLMCSCFTARCSCSLIKRRVPYMRLCLPAFADVLVQSQHDTEAKSEWWSNAFAAVIRQIGHTVLVLQPWFAPLALTRSWCLWEIFSTLDAGAPLEVLLPPAEAVELHSKLNTQFDAVTTALSQIDTRRAVAKEPTDKAMIDAAVRASDGGFFAVNSRILERLREWLLQQTLIVAGERAAEHGEAAPEALAARSNLARMLRLLGHTAEAVKLCRELAEAVGKAHGERSPQALAAHAAHADALMASGDIWRALSQLRSILKDQQGLHYGQPEHPDVVASQVAYARGMLAVCSCAARNIVDIRTFPPLVVASKGNTALFMKGKRFAGALHAFTGKFEIALKQKRCPSILVKVVSLAIFILVTFPTFPLALVMVMMNVEHNMKQVIITRGYPRKAAALCRAAHASLVHGEGTPAEIHSCAALLARALHDDGRLSEAVPLLRDAVRSLAVALGDEHLHTLAAQVDLADLLRERGGLGDVEEAETILRAQAPRLEEQLGASHPDALLACINVAICVAWRGDLIAAQAMLRATRPLLPSGDGATQHTSAPSRLYNVATEALRDTLGYSDKVRSLYAWCAAAGLVRIPFEAHVGAVFRRALLSQLRLRKRMRRFYSLCLLVFLVFSGFIISEWKIGGFDEFLW